VNSSLRRRLQACIFGRPFVKRFALCYRTVVLSCLSVTLVYCGQTLRWIKMKLGVQVGLVPGDIVLDGDPAPQKGRYSSPPLSADALRPNGWMDQDATWCGGRPQPWPHCVRWGSRSPPLTKTGTAPNFRPRSVVAKRLNGSRCHLVER